MFSSFSFQVVDCSAMTELCGLSFQLKVLLCFAAGTTGLLIQAKLVYLLRRAPSVPKSTALEMWRLTWSLFCDPEWKPAHFTVASPPLKERRVERWT